MKISKTVLVATGAPVLAISLAVNLFLGYHLTKPPTGESTPVPTPPSAAPSTASQPAAPTSSLINRVYFHRYTETVYLECSQPVVPMEVREHLQLIPETEFTVTNYGENSIQIRADWQPDTNYRLTLRSGLPIGSGTLERDYSHSFVTPRAMPQARFATAGKILPRYGKMQELPLQVRNTKNVTAELRQIYPENLLNMQYNDSMMKSVAKQNFAVAQATDASRYWMLPLHSLLPDDEPGIYSLKVSTDPDSYYGNEQIITITDLGISAALSNNRIMVMVRRLSDGAPVAEAEVKLFSRKNQLLAQGFTDAAGSAALEFSLAEDPEDAACLLTATLEDDRSYLEFFERDTRLDDSQFAVLGQPQPAADQTLLALVTPERGIMRPGETVTCFAQLREAGSLALPDPQPIEWVVRNPAWQEIARQSVTTDEFGFATGKFTLSSDAPGGVYNIALQQPGGVEWGAGSILVSHFVPDRIKVTTAVDPALRLTGGPTRLTGEAAYYFNAPAAERQVTVTAQAKFRPFQSRLYPDHVFGQPPPNANVLQSFKQSTESDADGKFQMTVPDLYPVGELPNALVETVVNTTVTGAAGRGVTALNTVLTHVNRWYLGLGNRTDTSAGVSIDWVALSAEDQPMPLSGNQLHYQLERREWNYVLQEQNHVFKRQWIDQLLPAGAGQITVADQQSTGKLDLAIQLPGEYRLRLFDAESAVAAEYEFYYQRGDDQIRPANAALLKFTTDKERYRPGEVAQLSFELNRPGVVLVAAGGDRAETLSAVAGTAGRNTIAVPIPAELHYGSWYVGVSALSHDSLGEHEPERAFGVAQLAVDQNASRLQVQLNVPAVSRPESAETLSLTLTGADGKPVAGLVQLWAVDSGVLALTDWQTPDSFDFFYGIRQNPMEFFDLYGILYPTLSLTADGKIGGDARRMNLNAGRLNPFAPAIENSAVLIADAVAVGADGRAEVPVTWPRHTGAMRVMAFAIAENGVGSTAAEVVLRDRAGVQLSTPATVAPGDEFEVVCEVFNHDVPQLDGTLVWSCGPGLEAVAEEAAAALTLPRGAATTVRRRFRAVNRPGATTVTAVVQSGEDSWQQRAALSVRPMSAPITQVVNLILQPGESVNWMPTPETWYADSWQGSLSLGSSPVAQLGSLYAALDESFCYGAEQTAAVALPQLAMPMLTKAGLLPESFAADSPDQVNAAIRRLQNMQHHSGGFAMWPEQAEAWLDGSLFTIHFLLEAQQHGFALEANWRQRMVYYLNQVLQRNDVIALDRAYATYLLALADTPCNGVAEELLRTPESDPLTRFFAAAALLRGGRPREGREAFDRMLTEECWRHDGPLSAAAHPGLVLWLAMEYAPEHPALQPLLETLRPMLDQTNISSPAAAWAILGMARYGAAHGMASTTARVLPPQGGAVEVPAGQSRQMPLTAGTTEINNTGKGPLFLQKLESGLPLQARAEASGLQITRRYRNAAGQEVGSAAAGELITVELTIQGSVPVDQLILCDLLPGGLEIEDDRLATRYAPLPPAPATATTAPSGFQAQFLERQADRLLIAGYLPDTQPAVFTYRTRAVGRGSFQLPPVSAIAPGQPALRAVTVFDDRRFEIQ